MAAPKSSQNDGSGKNQDAGSTPETGHVRKAALDFDTTALGYRLARERQDLSFKKLHGAFAPQAVPAIADTSGMCELAAQYMQKMNHRHIALIRAAIGKETAAADSITERDLRAFLMMHPGVRELRMRNFISAGWGEKDWRAEVQERRDAFFSLCSMYEIPETAADKKMEAVHILFSGLSAHQRDTLVKTHGPDSDEPTKNDLRRLQDFFEISPETARNFWRRNNTDLLTLGDLIHKIRFSNDPKFTSTELEMLSLMCRKIGRPAIDPTDPAQFMELKDVFDDMCPEDGPVHRYQPLVFAAWLLNQDINLRPITLQDVARREEEFHTLMVFLGMDYWKSSGRLDSTTISSEPASYRAFNGKTNEDVASSALIIYSDGSLGRVDSVFDGVGGYSCGSVASSIAKNIFDVFALAGWFEGPEDLRRLFSTIDISIAMAQIFNSDHDLSSTIFNTSKRYIRTSQINMGTTATVSFQKGALMWVAHAGDSDCKIMSLEGDEPEMVFATLTHSKIVGLNLEAETSNRLKEMKEALPGGPASFEKLPIKEMLAMVAAAEQAAEERVQNNSMSYGITNYVASFLGGSAHLMHINNSTRNYSPIPITHPGKMMIAIASDGLWDNICEKDCVIIVKSSDNDSAEARSKLMDIARHHSVEYNQMGGFANSAELVSYLDDNKIAISDLDRNLLLSLKPGAETQISGKSGKDPIGTYIVEIASDGKASLKQKQFYHLSNSELRPGKDDDRTVNCRRLDEGFQVKG